MAARLPRPSGTTLNNEPHGILQESMNPSMMVSSLHLYTGTTSKHIGQLSFENTCVCITLIHDRASVAYVHIYIYCYMWVCGAAIFFSPTRPLECSLFAKLKPYLDPQS